MGVLGIITSNLVEFKECWTLGEMSYSQSLHFSLLLNPINPRPNNPNPHYSLSPILLKLGLMGHGSIKHIFH